MQSPATRRGRGSRGAHRDAHRGPFASDSELLWLLLLGRATFAGAPEVTGTSAEAGEEEKGLSRFDLRVGIPLRDMAATTLLPLHPARGEQTRVRGYG